MKAKIKLIILSAVFCVSGAIWGEEEKYIYNIDEAAKHHNDIFVSPYIGASSSHLFNPGLGVNVLVVNMKYLPFVYFNGNFEAYLNATIDFNAHLGVTLGGLQNQEQKIVVNSYSGGYNVTVHEYIPVYIPVQWSYQIFGVARREQMPSYLNTLYGGNTVENNNLQAKNPPDNGAMFYGLGVGIFYVGDYVVTVDKGSSFHKVNKYRGASNTTLSLLYSPDNGLYKGFAGALDIASHWELLSMNIGFIYSFAPDSSFGSLSILDRMILKFALGVNFGFRTKPNPVFDINCTVTGKSMEECGSK